MPIKRTYICDCCGRTFEPSEPYYEVTVESHGYFIYNGTEHNHWNVYCYKCEQYLMTAVNAIPRLRNRILAKAESDG